jgi:hypothetical protein
MEDTEESCRRIANAIADYQLAVVFDLGFGQRVYYPLLF